MTVKEIYNQLLAQGYKAKDAAKEAQARTGYSLVTGKRIRPTQHKLKNTTYKGQYG